jgi:hypothetical protein
MSTITCSGDTLILSHHGPDPVVSCNAELEVCQSDLLRLRQEKSKCDGSVASLDDKNTELFGKVKQAKVSRTVALIRRL